MFDESWYRFVNKDVDNAIKAGVFASGFDHYNTFGRFEGRDPNALFDTSYYLLSNPDVFASGINPLDHFVSFGWFEQRNPSLFFDTSYYLQQNPDVANSLINPLAHYLTFGGTEGRDPSLGFDSSKYLADNPDVAAAGFNPLVHFLTFGQKEGRDAYDTSGNLLTGSPEIPQEGILTEIFFTRFADLKTGTDGNDKGTANIDVTPEGNIVNTLNSADEVNFKNGNDSLLARISATPGSGPGMGTSEYEFLPTGPRPTLMSLETITFEPINAANNGTSMHHFDASGTSGLTDIKFQNSNGSMTINNILNTLSGGLTITDPITNAAAYTLRFQNSALSDPADAMTVTLNSINPNLAGNFGAVTINTQTGTNALETVNLVSTSATPGTTNGLTTIAVQGATTLNIAAAVAGLAVSGNGAFGTVNVTGSNNVTWGTPLTGAGGILTTGTVAASDFTGNLAINVDTGGHTITSGSGNDVVNFSAGGKGYAGVGSATVDTWDGKSGTDQVVLINADVVGGVLTQSQTNLTSIEQGRITDSLDGTADLQHFNSVGINEWFFNGGGNAGGVDQINFGSTAVTMTLGVDFNQQLTVNHVGLSGPDSITFNMNADIVGNLVFDGFEAVTINTSGSNDDKSLNGISAQEVTGDLDASASGGAPAPITLTGSTNFEIVGSSDVQVLNGTSFTGRLIMSQANGTDLAQYPTLVTGAVITGGSGNDILVGNSDATLADTIDGGDGADRILGSVSNPGGATGDHQIDTLTGGLGNDTFVFAGTSLVEMFRTSGGADGATQVTRITDFAVGSDTISFLVDANTDGVADGLLNTFVLENTQNILTASTLADLEGAISALAVSTATTLRGSIISVQGGDLQGTYLYVNDAAGAGVEFDDDFLVNLTGMTGTFTQDSVVFA